MMKITVRRKVSILVIIILLLNGLVGYNIYRSGQNSRLSRQMVEHTQQVICQSANVLSLAKDIEGSSRGFVITNDSAFLKPFPLLHKNTFLAISELSLLIEDNPVQQKNVDTLNLFMHRLVDHSLRSINLRSNQGLAAAIGYITAGQGELYSGQLRRLTSLIQQEEARLLKLRLAINEDTSRIFDIISVSVFILMVALTCILIVLASKSLLDNAQKEKRDAALAIAGNMLLASQEIAQYGDFELIYATGISCWSEQLCKIFGLLPGDNNRSYDFLLSRVHPDDFRTVLNLTTGFQASIDDLDFYHRIVLKDGTVKHLHTWHRIECNASGDPISLHIVSHDITHQVTNITQLKTQNDQLSEIAWIQSHKVRSPLCSIMGLARLLTDHADSVDTREIIQGILHSSEQLDKVIRETVNNTEVSAISGGYYRGV